MRILLLSTCDTPGGAARAAYGLHRGLQNAGHESAMLVQRKSSQDRSVHELDWRAGEKGPVEMALGQQLQNEVNCARTELTNTYFSVEQPCFDLSGHPLVQAADIVSVHWVAGFQNAASIARLCAAGKRVVWTLHDQRPLTGGCHFSAGCCEYERACQSCPQLNKTYQGVAAAGLADQREALKREALTLVSPSRWLADCARKSALFSKARTEVVSYGIDTEVFKPVAKGQARQELGLASDSVLFLFGAEYCEEKRKGFVHLRRALERCCESAGFRQAVEDGRVQFVAFGSAGSQLVNWPTPVRSFGRVQDVKQMALLYAAADAFILPSVEDNLPNVMLESMCCGTPVVGFDVGGMPDAVLNGETGLLAPVRDEGQLAAAVLQLAQDGALRRRLVENCEGKAGKLYSWKVQAESYLKIFEELLSIAIEPGAKGGPSSCGGTLISPGSEWRRIAEVVREEQNYKHGWRKLWRKLTGGRGREI